MQITRKATSMKVFISQSIFIFFATGIRRFFLLMLIKQQNNKEFVIKQEIPWKVLKTKGF